MSQSAPHGELYQTLSFENRTFDGIRRGNGENMWASVFKYFRRIEKKENLAKSVLHVQVCLFFRSRLPLWLHWARQ